MSNQIKISCDMCSTPTNHSHGRYYGRHIPSWKVYVCRDCEGQNHDGIIPEHHPKFMAKLKANDVQVQLDENEVFYFPPRGS